MAAASDGCELPEKTISRFDGPRSSQWLLLTSGRSAKPSGSRPGRKASVVALSIDISLLVHLARRETGQRGRRDILGDHRSRIDPCVVADVDWSDERIVDAGPDVTADGRPPLL